MTTPAPPTRQTTPTWRRVALHVFRIALFATVIVLIRQQHVWLEAQASAAGNDVPLTRLQAFYPSAAALSDVMPETGGRTVVDTDGKPLGYFVLTSPNADHIVGYSGPNNVLIAFDTKDQVLGVLLLRSGDTPEHADDVVFDESFMRSWDGLTWDVAADKRDVDAVSGATLTSLAIAQGVAYRLGGAKPSYLFPETPTAPQIKPIVPDAASISPIEGRDGEYDIRDASHQTIGRLARTGATMKPDAGYQGPTDTLLVFDTVGRLKGFVIDRTYDNQPYVGYVADDYAFPDTFLGKSTDELAALDLAAEGVEGVSGATMTSMAVAQSIVEKTKQMKAVAERAKPQAAGFAPRLRDYGTVAVVVAGVVIGLTRLRHVKWLRVVFQVVLVVYLGLINGDMVSQALGVGWARSGLPWRIAPGLVALVVAALVVPMFTRTNVYCHHLCPHGVVQQWVKGRLPWQWTPPRGVVRVLDLLPAALLAWVVCVAMIGLTFSLVNIEPFDAYVIQTAGWATIAVAVVGLVASLFIPMAYCRFGCPTGAVLGFLRWNSGSGRVAGRDVVAVALVVLAGALMFAR